MGHSCRQKGSQRLLQSPPLQSLLHHHRAIPPASLFRGLSASSLKDIRPPIPSQLISHQQNQDLFLNEVIF